MNERLGNGAPNALMRIECTLRILLHEPQGARKQTAISTRFTHERRAIEFYTAGRRRLEREQKPRQRALAASTLADDSQNLACTQSETHTIEHSHCAVAFHKRVGFQPG